MMSHYKVTHISKVYMMSHVYELSEGTLVMCPDELHVQVLLLGSQSPSQLRQDPGEPSLGFQTGYHLPPTWLYFQPAIKVILPYMVVSPGNVTLYGSVTRQRYLIW